MNVDLMAVAVLVANAHKDCSVLQAAKNAILDDF